MLGMVALCAAVVLAGQARASATGVEQLRRFVADTRSAEGSFEQVVTASSGVRQQHASGSFAFARPGKFRWNYAKPYPQLLVSDGVRLWAWDQDLNQVTVKVLGDALGSTPVAILAGDGTLDRDFDLREGGEADGYAWVVAKPRQADSAFESMRIGLSDGQLRRMELRDNFGQTTLIVFTRLMAGVDPAPDLFRFEPPLGADVIGD
ncbi:MAG: outer membrane lipoprotein chaperone LolA [Rhodocyclales bacterium]|nr:outer membrane lipoprotein chaperone LolA [Rhodocyclales bacterium]